MLELGMPTLIELEDLEANVVLCKKLNLSFIELNLNMPEFQPNRLDAERLNKIKQLKNIYFTFHLPEDLDIGHFNIRVREANLQIIKETIDIAQQIKAPVINMHMNSGVHFTLPEHKVELYEKYQNEYLKNIDESMQQIEKMLEDTEVSLAIENTGIFNKDFITQAVELLLRSDKCVLTWDIGHDYSSGSLDEAFIMKHLEKLRHMHIHDALGEKNHLELYTGEMDLERYFKTAQQNKCRCVIETKTIEALEKSIIKLKARGL